MNAVSDDNTLDCFEWEQAERMMEGDNVEKHIQSAHNRIFTMEREVIAYIFKEEEEELRDKDEEDGYDQGWEVSRHCRPLQLSNYNVLEQSRKQSFLFNNIQFINQLIHCLTFFQHLFFLV